MKRNLIFIFLILQSFAFSFSQTNYRFENISTQQGLIFDNVSGIVQDKNGFIWFAATYGLNQYNGYTLNGFSNKYNNKKTLNESVVRRVFLDKSKNLWIQGDNLNKFESSIEQFEQYISPKPIYQTAQDTNGNLWTFSRPSFITLFESKSQKYISVDFDSMKSKGINLINICIDHDNTLWILNLNRVISKYQVFRASLNDYYKTKKLVISTIFESKAISCIYNDHKNNVWIFEKGTLKYYDKDKAQFTHVISIPWDNEFEENCMYRDSKEHIWIGLSRYEGLVCVDIKAKTYQRFKANISGKNKLYADVITSIFEDSFGVLWIGTINNGVYKMNLNVKKFTLYNTDNGLPENNVQSIFEDSKETLFLGSYKGLTLLKNDKMITVFKEDPLKPHLFIANSFISLCELPNNYIASAGIGLSISNFNNNDYYFLPDNSDSSLATGWALYNIHKGQKSGHYWISGTNGFNEISDFRLDKAIDGNPKKICPRIKLFNEKTIGISDLVCWSIYEDKDGIIWVCSSRGLFRYNPATNKFKHFAFDINNPNALHARDVNSCCEDHNGQLWFTTLGGGLSRFDRKTESFFTITEADGLPSNHLYGVLEDSKGNLWISSNKGLCKYNPDTKQIRYYDESDGIQGNAFTQWAYFKTTKGKMYFGGKNGVSAFYPDSIIDNQIPPIVVITKLFINNKTVEVGEKVNGDIILKQSLIESPKIELSHWNKVFAIEFAGLHTVAPEKIKYQYKMEGIDQEWFATDAQHRRAYYSNLPAGTYTFRVKACNSDGVWNKEECSILIKAIPPFYKTWWFITFIISFIVFVIFIFIKWREKKLRQEKEILEEKVKIRTVLIEDQKEEIAIQRDELSDKKDQLEQKNKNITDSISYARRIQFSILPEEENLNKNELFIFFRPKDIVSGDFYWITEVGDFQFISAIDCTGHGVPGAFMSLIAHELLNKIVKENHIFKPSEILHKLNFELHKKLQSQYEGEAILDGMDMSLVAFNKETKKLEFAGAFNSLYHVRESELTEIKANRFAIGKNTDSSKEFTNHEINIQKGDTVYLFSDGYEDQFGGNEGKKFTSRAMKSMLTSIQNLSMPEQKEHLIKTFDDWKDKYDQIDDVLVMGRRF